LIFGATRFEWKPILKAWLLLSQVKAQAYMAEEGILVAVVDRDFEF
jgi:hypothetical protein